MPSCCIKVLIKKIKNLTQTFEQVVYMAVILYMVIYKEFNWCAVTGVCVYERLQWSDFRAVL